MKFPPNVMKDHPLEPSTKIPELDSKIKAKMAKN